MFPSIEDRQDTGGLTAGAAALAGAAVGAAIGATAMSAKKLDETQNDSNTDKS